VRVKGLFRSTVGACLLAGVVWVSSGFAVVSGEKTVAKPGGVCSQSGATAVTKSVSLVCKKVASGKLVWRAVKASTTSTTTTVAPIKNSAPKVAVVAPRVVSASSATGNAVITIADMSPDTGVYAVQWVSFGQDFNSYQMYRTTSKTMTVPYLACTRSYTLRVFVMQETWQMSDGFVNQNVTPHSATFDLTMPACTATTTTTVALTCATGGTCAVGDTGPGGGVVFYVAGSNFTSTGSDCGTTCRYLEAAPAPGGGDVTRSWATDTDPGVGSGNQETAVPAPGATATGIGSGMANTNAIQAQTGNAAATSAAVYAYGYSNGGKTDWHLASLDELNELCKYARNTGQAAGAATVCSGGSAATGRGFTNDNYWSSTEVSASSARIQDFNNGDRSMNGSKGLVTQVRPVRAFG